jgi:hypothetical protein
MVYNYECMQHSKAHAPKVHCMFMLLMVMSLSLLLLFLQVDQTVVEQLGVARKVTCASTSTTLIADAASKDEIDMRIAQVGLQHSKLFSVAMCYYAAAAQPFPVLWSAECCRSCAFDVLLLGLGVFASPASALLHCC